MKPVKIYFAAAWAGGGQGERHLVEEGIRNKLCSYVYPSQLSGWLEAIKEIPRQFSGSIIIDSGAFSAWNRGEEIDFDKYIEYAHQAINDASELGAEIRIVNLDVIPGKVGQTKSLTKNFSNPDNAEVIEKAAKKGYKNLRKMLKNGITPIHVFHQGENPKWLDRMVEKTDYIGISPANDMPALSRRNWIESVFDYLYKNNIDVKTHGFAVHSREVLINYPWTSCDAASWRLTAGMGNIYFPAGGYKNPDFSKKAIVLNVSEKTTGRGIGKMTNKVVEILEESGFSYEDLQSWQTRTRLNVRYFLALEEWINKKRAEKEYKPRKKML
jgi:hypothetical protein